MSISFTTSINQREMQSKIEEIKQRFGGDVITIRHSPGTNWMGDPAIYFRILLADAVANNRDRLADVTGRVRWELFEELNLAELDPTSYFNFRSQSEQAELKDPEWD